MAKNDKKAKGKWKMHIGKMEAEKGKEVVELPVFGWTYCVGSLCGGNVHAWPHLGYFTFQTTRRDYDKDFKGSASEIVVELERFGWEVPQHLSDLEKDIKKSSDILKDINKCSVRTRRRKADKFMDECKSLEERWQEYL